MNIAKFFRAPVFTLSFRQTINDISLFQTKITATVTRSSHQDRGLCYLYFPIFYTKSLLFYWKIKTGCYRCFPQQIRQQVTVQWYILRNYSSVKVLFNMINKHHTLRIVFRQGWTNSFLGARLFGCTILLARARSGTKKMVCQNRSVRPIETELEALLFFFII